MASVGTVPAPAQSRSWGVAKWFAFRFTFAYLVLYNNPVGMLAALVQSEGIGRVWERVEHPVVQWFARDVLRMPNPITIFPSGSGDTTYNYVQIVFYAVVSFLVAAAWTVLRKRQEEPRAVYALLRTYVRYCLALTLLNYGTIKLFKDQFPALGPEKLLQTYG